MIKNTYRVLLSRGLKGCYVYFMDEETRNFFESRMETPYPLSKTQHLRVAEGGNTDG